jgi:ATP-dependent helicase/nuclease subunit A
LVLEQLDVTQAVTAATVQATIDDLVAKHVLTPAVAQRIQIDQVVGFYASSLGQQILAAPAQVHREVPFSLLLPAQRLFKGFEADPYSKILIHGIIDGYLATEQGLILFDYKTDHVAKATDLLTKYAGQVKLYGQALSSMYQQPIAQQYLYSLVHQELVSVN